jgi:hypothetical protein
LLSDGVTTFSIICHLPLKVWPTNPDAPLLPITT